MDENKGRDIFDGENISQPDIVLNNPEDTAQNDTATGEKDPTNPEIVGEGNTAASGGDTAPKALEEKAPSPVQAAPKKPGRKRLELLTLVLVVFSVVFGIIFFIDSGKVNVTPTLAQGEEVSPTTAFHIKVGGGSTIEEVRAKISTQPTITYDLKEMSKGIYLLTPNRVLDAGSALEITVDKKVFSYKVQNTLILISQFPYDGGTKVPIRSGIELTFNSNSISLNAIQKAFKIQPEVVGEFTHNESKYVFYPSTEYLENTLYTVTLDNTLVGENGATLTGAIGFSFTTSSNKEEEARSNFSIVNRENAFNYLSDQAPIIQAYIRTGDEKQTADFQAPNVDVKLYSFANADDYRDQLSFNSTQASGNYNYEYHFNKDKLSEYASFSVSPIKAAQTEEANYYQSDSWLIQLPNNLPEGWYGAELTANINGIDVVRPIFIQISDLSVFYMTLDENIIVWVNDTKTGKPVADAQFKVSGGMVAEGKTGPDGSALVGSALRGDDGHGYQYQSSVFTLSVGNQTFVDARVLGDYNYKNAAQDYISYLFTDRSIYKTTDTIHVWGTLRPRSDEIKLPENPVLSMLDDTIQQPIKLNPNGTFTADISYENITSDGWADISLKDGEETLAALGFPIEDFVKPVYTAKTGESLPVYLTTTAKDGFVTFDVATFDGTPASSFKASVTTWSDGIKFLGDSNLVTDAQGHISAPFTITASANSWYPQTYSYHFASNDAESENFNQYSSINVIHRDLMLDATAEIGKESVSLDVNTNMIDISNVKTSEDLWDFKNIKGATVDKEITAKLHKLYYTKEEIGKHYDFISREMVSSYKYIQHDDVVDNISFKTVNGVYTVKDLPKSNDENCYYLELASTDSIGRAVVITAYLGSYFDRGYYGDDGMHRYVLRKVEDNVGGKIGADIKGQYQYGYYYNEAKFGDGEDVTFVLTDNDTPVESFKGNILYTVMQKGLSQPNVSESSKITLPFAENLVPNYLITGAYFDGRYVYALEDMSMTFNPAARELEVKIETDKETYYPGDNAQVTATVVYKATGKPAPDADIALSVADEAVFALREQSIDILNQIYQSVYSPSPYKYASYTQVNFGSGAEKGGGGDGNDMRTDFKDTAHFSAAKTGADGKAVFTLKLPDNITAWRITGIALNDQNYAGSAKIKTIATKDFFLTPIINEKIIVGDSFTLGLRSAGIGVLDSDKVDYTVKVEGASTNKEESIASTIKGYTSLRFDGLVAGDYTVTVTGKSADYTDSIRLPFSVVPSAIELTLVKSFNLADGIAVNPLRYPVSISFYDRAYQNYARVTNSVAYSSYGVRADMRIARAYIAAEFEKQGNRWYNYYQKEESMIDINGSSLIALFPYDTPDIELTAKAALAAPDFVTATGMKYITIDDKYFLGSKAAIYLGKVLANEKLEIDLNKMIESSNGLDYVDKMYLAIALAKSGDAQGAKSWYDKLVLPNLADIKGVSGEIAQYVNLADGIRSKDDCTAAALMLASVLNAKEADTIALYLTEKPSRFDPYILEKMVYLRYFAPKETDQKPQFSYIKDGEVVTLTLDKGPINLSFSKESLNAADFKVLSGEVKADVFYAGAITEKADDSAKNIGFTKTIQPMEGDISRGKLVKITLTPNFNGLDAVVGNPRLVIDDYIPSGMRFERYDFDRSYDYGWYMVSRQGQRLQYCAYGLTPTGGFAPIVYYARCATPGEYVVESAYISSAVSESWGMTERSTIEIK